MTVLGAGKFPAGSYPCGYGQPTVSTVPSLVPYPDPVTGLAQSGYQVGPNGDYGYTADGRVIGCPTVKSLVEHACSTLFGSSAVPGFGIQLPGGVKTSNYSSQVKAMLSNTLSALVAQKLITIVSITVANMVNHDGTVGILTWRDLTAPAPTTGGTTSSNQFKTAF